MKKILIIAAIVLLNFSFNEKANTEEKFDEKAYSTAISGLYVRETPSAKAKALGLIKYNTKFTILEYSKTEETIGAIKAPWIKIKVISEKKYDLQNIEGWVFGGFIDKNEPIKNSELINSEKYDFATIVKLLDNTCKILLIPGPIANLYFTGDKVIRDNNFIYVEVPAGDKESYIEKIEYNKDICTLTIKHESLENNINKTQFFKCNIPKKIVIDIYNKKIKDQKIECVLKK